MCSFDGKNAKKNGPILKELERIAEPEVVEWLVDEMTANRQKQVVRDKVSVSPGILPITLNSQDGLERRGRRLWALITGFATVHSRYHTVCHLHSQSNIFCEEAGFVGQGRDFLISSGEPVYLCYPHFVCTPPGKCK